MGAGSLGFARHGGGCMSLQPPPTPDAPLSDIETSIVRQLRSLRFGALEIQVHDARVVQIERRERVRFDDRIRPR